MANLTLMESMTSATENFRSNLYLARDQRTSLRMMMIRRRSRESLRSDKLPLMLRNQVRFREDASVSFYQRGTHSISL